MLNTSSWTEIRSLGRNSNDNGYRRAKIRQPAKGKQERSKVLVVVYLQPVTVHIRASWHQFPQQLQIPQRVNNVGLHSVTTKCTYILFNPVHTNYSSCILLRPIFRSCEELVLVILEKSSYIWLKWIVSARVVDFFLNDRKNR